MQNLILYSINAYNVNYLEMYVLDELLYGCWACFKWKSDTYTVLEKVLNYSNWFWHPQ